jgi:anti-sigma regulatory factor (Ser/Thr protein kinase)
LLITGRWCDLAAEPGLNRATYHPAVPETREALLPPRLESVTEARRLVTELVAGSERPELADSAALLASELASNAVLHARTEFRVVAVLNHCVRIEVHDRSRTRPVVRHSVDGLAGTGRGLQLVERLSEAWGVELNSGKVVWCRICEADASEVAAGMEIDLDAWLEVDAEIAASEDEGTEPLFDVVLRGLPVDVYVRSWEHSAELGRELQLLSGVPDHGASLPHQLRRLIYELASRYGPMNPAAERRLQDAVVAGEQEVDVHYRVPRRTADDVMALDRVLREVDEHCRAGRWLLTMATPAEAERFREWVFGEICAQIEGEAPRRWADWLEDQR